MNSGLLAKRGIPSALLGIALLGLSCRQPEPPATRARILRHLTVYEARGEYCAWPDIARTPDGDLIVAFCRSEEHLGPDGQILLSRSTDKGSTWQSPEVIFNSSIDDRESGFTTLADGRILGHFWSTFHTPEYYAALHPGSYEEPVLARWSRHVQSPRYLAAKDSQGAWCAVTSDGGKSWSKPVGGKDAVHGGIQLKNGSLLVASYRDFVDSIGVFAAAAPMSSWSRLALVCSPQPESLSFGEPHLLQIPSGRVIMMIRATARPYNDQDPRCVLWETFSDDNGQTWAQPFATPLWGFPPHLLLLSDGRIVCSYGYRRPPFGQRACISNDGISWSLQDEVVIRDDAPNTDLGYPGTIEIETGVVLTVYYQPDVPRGTVQRMKPPDPERVKPAILATIWQLPGRRH
jgi:sialidase-1